MAKPPRISLAEMARQTGTMLRRGDSGHFVEGQAPTLADLTESLFFSPGDGRIWLNDQRMLLLHSSAVGHLRRELIDTLGTDRARGLLTRAGYVSGARDAQLVRERWPHGDAANVFMAGTRLHALEGVVKVTPLSFEFDIDRGTYEGEFLWEHSSEDDEHIAAYGIGTEAACWSQVGYATGYVTSLFGQLVIFREIECRSMGAGVCRVVGRHAAAWGDVSEDLRYLEAKDFRHLRSAPLPAADREHALTGLVPSATAEPASAAATGADKHEIVGASSAFNSACHQLARVAGTRATVLFTGESGVGKEAFARRLHRVSARSQQPFVAVNCAAIPETLIESELFGVERGAFTGASQSRPGRFERADGGTLFLDEIGTLSLVSQGKLLRALQEGEVERVGGTRTIHVDVRVVAATNVDLQAEVRAGRFREDL
jgi:two-component system response regulator HydG